MSYVKYQQFYTSNTFQIKPVTATWTCTIFCVPLLDFLAPFNATFLADFLADGFTLEALLVEADAKRSLFALSIAFTCTPGILGLTQSEMPSQPGSSSIEMPACAVKAQNS